MGKTTLLFHILERYRQFAQTAFIFNTQCSSYDLLQALLSELDDKPAPREAFQLHERFKEILAAAAEAHQRVILVIDEAHNLGDTEMETVRLLSNFESANSKLLHIILAGHQELAGRLSRSELSQLQQRIPILNTLPCLSPAETASYIDHRLRVAGYQGKSLFAPDPLARIAELSRGVPREINRICFNCLSLAYAAGKSAVDLAVVHEVAADLNLAWTRIETEDLKPQQEPAQNVVRAAAATTAARESSKVVDASGPTAGTATTTPSVKPFAWPRLTNQRPQSVGREPKLASAPARTRSPRLLAPRRRRWRPFVLAAFYLTVAVGGWTSATRWIYPNLVAGHPSVAHLPEENRNLNSRPSASEPSVSVDDQPGLIRFVQPQYPKNALNHHIEGKVVMKAMVGGNGRVKRVTLLKGDPTLLKAAETAVRAWIYRPYQVDGKSVDIYREIVISFSLPENQP
jgi:TonB family protein